MATFLSDGQTGAKLNIFTQMVNCIIERSGLKVDLYGVGRYDNGLTSRSECCVVWFFRAGFF